jgi:hypothetical protein
MALSGFRSILWLPEPLASSSGSSAYQWQLALMSLSVSPFFERSKHTQRLQLLPENCTCCVELMACLWSVIRRSAQYVVGSTSCYPIVLSIRRRSATCCRLQDAKESVSCWFRVFSNVDVIIWWTDTESALGHAGLVSISIQIPCAWLCWICLPPKLAFFFGSL